jgi:Glycosyl transferase family 2
LSLPTISVVLPTFNCRPLMARHLDAMEQWLELAHEVVVVDSRSTDGTIDLIRNRLRHANLRIIERERGLYASWNEGIAATTSDWVYISTAGDTIEREQLERLRRCGEASRADAVIGPYRFVDETGLALPTKTRRIPYIHQEIGGSGPVLLPPQVVRHLSFRSAGTHALLGSCASDLFRGDFLRARPFPLDYGTHGDTAWTLRHAHEMRLCVVPEHGSTFCVHAKEASETKGALMDTLDRMFETEFRAGSTTGEDELALKVRGLMRLRREAWRGRRSVLSWLSANMRYLPLRAVLGLREKQAWARLRRLVAVVPPA